MVQTIITPTIPPITVRLPKGKTVIHYGLLKIAAAYDPGLMACERSVPMYVAKALTGRGCIFSEPLSRLSVGECLAGAEAWQAAWLIHAWGERLGHKSEFIIQAVALLLARGEPVAMLR